MKWPFPLLQPQAIPRLPPSASRLSVSRLALRLLAASTARASAQATDANLRNVA